MGEMRGTKNSGADSYRRAFGIFRFLGLSQRAMGGVAGVSRSGEAAFKISAVRNTNRGAEPDVCETCADQFHRGASGVSWKRFGATRKTVRRESERLCRHRGGAGGTGTGTVIRGRLCGEEISPSCA